MKTSIKTLIATALAGTALFSALPASAYDGDWDRGDRHEWRDHREWREDQGWHHRHYPRYEERVVVRERPVYREYYAPAPVYYSPRYYYAPPPVRYYQAEPSITLGVDIPIR